MEPYIICSFMPGLFHLVWCPQGSSTWNFCQNFHSLLRLSNISLIAYHIVFILSPVYKQLYNFYLLVFENNASMNIGLFLRPSFQILLDIYWKVELMDHMVNLFLIFLRNNHCVFHRSCTMTQTVQFLHIFANSLFACFEILAILMGMNDMSWF